MREAVLGVKVAQRRARAAGAAAAVARVVTAGGVLAVVAAHDACEGACLARRICPARCRGRAGRDARNGALAKCRAS